MTEIFKSRYYRINKFYLSFIGRWPFQSRRRRLFLLACVVCLELTQIPPQIIATVKNWDEPEVIADLTPFLILTTGVTVRMVYISFNVDKLLQIFRRIEIDWMSVAGQPEIQISRNYAEVGRRMTIGYSVGLYFTMVVFMVKPFIPIIRKLMKSTNETPSNKLLFPIDYYGLNVNTYYYYILTFMYISIIISVLIFVATDTMFLIHVQHACGKFAIVSHQLQLLDNYITEEYVNYSHPKLDPAFRHLSVCIEKHRDAIEFTGLLNASYTWLIFICLGTGMLSLSYAGVKSVSLMEINPNEAVRYVAFEITIITMMFFLSFISQKLLDHSGQIGKYLCQTEWYKTSLATQKLLILLIMKAHVPCQLTAGTFVALSMENFTLILKTCFSYFTFMRSME